MHTITRHEFTQAMFESQIPDDLLSMLNAARGDWRAIKNILPEGFLQRRVWCMNYRVLQHIHAQRHDHRLPQWHTFLEAVLAGIQHPEFIVRGEK